MDNEQNNLEPTGAVAVIYRDLGGDKEYLLVSQKSGFLSLAGGGREDVDEDIDDTIVRELSEELNLSPDEYSITRTDIIHEFTYGDWKPERVNQRAKELMYIIKIDPNVEVVAPNLDEVNDALWFNEQEACEKITPKDLLPDFNKALELIKAE